MASFSIPLTGLEADSTALNTIANDLSNMNTTAYKAQDTNFSDLFYQQIGESGSGDAIQVGAGTRVSGTSTDFTEGTILPDSNANSADMALAGNGFFVVEQGGVQSLTLEHYAGMTEREIARCTAEAESRWPLLGVTVIHRVGKLIPGERIVLVAVASAHRKAAFEACEFLMDYLKTRAPFWKEEQRSGEARWVEHHASDEEAAKRWR